MTTAPSLTMSAVTNFGVPSATIKISDWNAMSLIFGVLLWHMTTVALPGFPLRDNKILMGVPTILLLPMTQHCFPLISILYLFSISMIPMGVAGRYAGSPSVISPIFIGWK